MKTVRYSLLLAAALCAASFNASADTTRKWCATWKTDYVDAGFGEDYFTQSTLTSRPAQYAWGELVNRDTSAIVWTGYFDGSGCTPYLPVGGFTNYELRQGTKLVRENRTMLVVNSTAPAGDWTSWYYYYQRVQTGLVVFDSHTTVTLNLSVYNSHTNVLPILGRILYLYNTMEYPSGTTTAVRTDATGGCTIGKYIGNGRVCVASDFEGEDETTWKFITAHEVGHRQADATGGPMDGSYDAPVSQTLCKCDHVSGTDPMIRYHCLQSREYINTAETEGWAQFYATRLFNNQQEGHGTFVYYKQAWINLGFWEVAQPPVAFNAYYNGTWMEDRCLADDRGVELDWLNFFWNVHTAPEGSVARLSVDELTNVWAAAGYQGRWDEELFPALLSALPGDESSDNYLKRWNFYAKGIYAGVVH